MDKNEILEKSKAEFKGGDPYFEAVQSRYMRRGLLVVIVLATVFYLAEMLVRREMNLGFLAIVCVNAAALYKRKPERWRRTVATLASAAVVLAVAGHFMSLFFL